MNEHDRAVVIGIRRYGDATDPSGWIGNLNGPDNDAEAIAAWLRKPTGGDLPHDNVRCVRSADLPDPFPDRASVGPHQLAVKAEFDALAALPTNAYDGQYAGRRLYVYASGHGFARHDDEAALITAEAIRDDPLNMLITSCVGWFWKAGRFQEYVVWVDCCAVRQPLAHLQIYSRTQQNSANAAKARRFIAFAAGIGLQAVENQMPDGKWHGAFTYALLQGLEGAVTGPVTTNSLSNYLRNNMASFMREDQRQDGSVALEPAFAKVDPIEFHTPVRSKFAVKLRFPPDCVGKRATISVDASSPLAGDIVLTGPEWDVELPTSSYVVFVPDAGKFLAFTVTGESDAVFTVQ